MRTENDAKLLKAYAETNDEGAFDEIVSRHGTMVYRACFRTLVNRHDAEDASQAVFMTLIKKSEKLCREGSLACWLYKVARQTALFMARTRARRGRMELAASEVMGGLSHSQVNEKDQEVVLGFLDKELNALSVGQREAVILCYLDGMNEKDAASIAGCSYDAFRSRLGDGISNLRKRLARRGCTFGVPSLIGVLAADAQAAVPNTLIPSLLAVPKLYAAGAASGAASANITYIMEGALKTMFIAKIKTAGIWILVTLLIGTTAVVAVKGIQKKQNLVTNEKPGIVYTTDKQNITVQPESSPVLPKNDELVSKEPVQKDKPPAAKVKQPPKARDFQAEAKEALKKFDFETFGAVMKEWAKTDPLAACELAMKIKEGGNRDFALDGVVGGWAETDPVATSEWAMKLPEGKQKDDALNRVALQWAKKDPAAAHEWVMALPEGNERNNALTSVVRELAKKDLIAASKWVMALPEGTAKNSALESVSREFAMKDPVAAYEWAMALPEGKQRDSALPNVVIGCAIKDPVTAFKWGMALPEGIKDITFQNVASIWAIADSEKAKRWIEESSLSQDQKDKLLKSIELNIPKK